MITAAVLEQAIAILPAESDNATSATVTMMVNVMNFMIVQTSVKYVDIDRTASFHQKLMLLCNS